MFTYYKTGEAWGQRPHEKLMQCIASILKISEYTHTYD